MKQPARTWLAVIALSCMAGATSAQDQRPHLLDRIADVGPALTRCWSAPAGSGGSEITVIMSFRRDGALIATPRISYSHLVGNDEAQKSFVHSVLDAIAACTPLHFSAGLAGSITGRPFAMRFTSTGAGHNI